MKHVLLVCCTILVAASGVVESMLIKEHYLEQKAEQEAAPKELLIENDAANQKIDNEQQLPVNRYKRQEAGDQTSESAVPEAGAYTYGNQMYGAGYSSDTQQLTPHRCFNVNVTSITAQGETQLDIALSASQLETKLGVSVSVSGSFGMFSAEAEASYLRSVQDDESSLSLNYYSYTTNEVTVQVAGNGETALTESGRSFYKGGGNRLFGLLCGDHYISSYQQGALLTMGLKIKFSSSKEKTQFKGQFGASYANIINVAANVENAVVRNNISGSITIQAFQKGGEPSQLAHIFNKDSEDNYYALSCSLTTMDMCKKAVSGLLNYATNDFSKQFSTQQNKGLTNLGVAFSRVTPIDYIELVYPESLVTPEVRNLRKELARRLRESEYYINKCAPFLNNKYPVALETTFLDKVHSLLSKANDNVGILMRKHGGAAECFTHPDKCKNVAASLYSELNNITTNDLKFLNLVKFSYISYYGNQTVYNRGSETAWIVVPSTGDSYYKLDLIELDGRKFACYSLTVKGEVINKDLCGLYRFTTEDGTEYVGMLDGVSLREMRKVMSPLFFEAYNSIVTS